MLISKINTVYRTERKFIYVSRPRRFGKSMAANMLTSYYSCGCDSSELFAGLKIEKEKSFPIHLNQHYVIRIDVQRFIESESELDSFIGNIEKSVVSELLKEFPEYEGFDAGSRLKTALDQIFIQSGKGFIFIIDEWDCIFRITKYHKEMQKEYLDFIGINGVPVPYFLYIRSFPQRLYNFCIKVPVFKAFQHKRQAD